MQNALAHLLSIDDLVLFSVDMKSTCVVLLSSRSGVEETLIQNDKVPKVILLKVIEDLYNSALEVCLLIIAIEE